jgi:exo-1,4-beta-D-glucosaminidase
MAPKRIVLSVDKNALRRKYLLNEGWDVINSAKVKNPVEKQSLPSYDTKDWNHCDLPQTAFASEVSSGSIKDPFFADNLLKCEGMVYKTKPLFCNEDMPESSPYRNPWYFRKEFILDKIPPQRRIWLCFDGINYSANLWINGKLFKTKDEFKGAFRRFCFDVTEVMEVSERNVIELEIFPPSPNDLSIAWADWNPYPPDKNMGIWQDVYLLVTGDIKLDSSCVLSRVDTDKDDAQLTIRVYVTNSAKEERLVNLLCRIEGDGRVIDVEKAFTLQGMERKEIVLSSNEYPQLRLKSPRLWWPHDYGEPFLYTLTTFALSNGELSDSEKINFGICEVTSLINEEGNLLLKVNGRPVIVLGGGFAPDLFLRRDYEKLRAQFTLTKEMGLNAIRLEGKLVDDHFFDLADKEGIMVIAGWNCGDAWEKWEKWTSETVDIALKSLEDQLLRLRKHPSVIMWMNGSDFHPPEQIEKKYLEIEKKVGWNRPIVSSATAAPSNVSGPTGVKMPGPYDYVPPNYWYEATNLGGAKGFLTEGGPGPSLPLKEELLKFIPEDKLWPINKVWDFHCGLGSFYDISRFYKALGNRYGPPKGVDDFLWKAQLSMYETERAMFEAFVRNRYSSTGVIHWMLNNSWPCLIWHLFSYYLIGNASYFAIKKALEKLHIQYCYDDDSIVVVNRTNMQYDDLKVDIKMFDINFNLIESFTQRISVGKDSNVKVLDLSKEKYNEEIIFLYLLLKDVTDTVISRNFYWLPKRKDVLDYPKTEFYHTPIKEFASLCAIERINRVQLDFGYTLRMLGNWAELSINILNNTDKAALLTRIRILDKLTGEEISPVYFSENFVCLVAREKITVNAKIETRLIPPTGVKVAIDGYNVIRKEL